MKVKVYSTSKHPLPQYATKQSAGLDLRANIDAPITINPRERVLVPTGLHIQLPEGFEARIQPRSGLALKKGITCLNSPGCVDADYRGDVGVILINHGTEPFTVNDGERIAQMIISKYEQAEWEPVSSIEDLIKRSSAAAVAPTLRTTEEKFEEKMGEIRIAEKLADFRARTTLSATVSFALMAVFMSSEMLAEIWLMVGDLMGVKDT